MAKIKVEDSINITANSSWNSKVLTTKNTRHRMVQISLIFLQQTNSLSWIIMITGTPSEILNAVCFTRRLS